MRPRLPPERCWRATQRCTTAGTGSAWCRRRAATNAREAADCYRRVLEFLGEHPDYAYDDGLERLYTGLIAKLDPPASAAT